MHISTPRGQKRSTRGLRTRIESHLKEKPLKKTMLNKQLEKSLLTSVLA